MPVNPDFSDLFSAFNSADVRYLIHNKRACGRPQDLVDADLLENT